MLGVCVVSLVVAELQQIGFELAFPTRPDAHALAFGMICWSHISDREHRCALQLAGHVRMAEEEFGLLAPALGVVVEQFRHTSARL
jgi:hypothetical protein